MQAFDYFASTVYREEHPEWVDYTIKVCEKHFKFAKEQQDDAAKKWAVVQTAHMANDPELSYLANHFYNTAVDILRQQGYLVDRYDFYISGMWGQNIGCYGGHTQHVHRNTQISGFFFLETPVDGAYPVFHDPRPARAMVELDFNDSQAILPATNAVNFANVRPGTLMLFNSWLPHQLSASRAQTESKFIHFTLSHKDKEAACNM